MVTAHKDSSSSRIHRNMGVVQHYSPEVLRSYLAYEL